MSEIDIHRQILTIDPDIYEIIKTNSSTWSPYCKVSSI